MSAAQDLGMFADHGVTMRLKVGVMGAATGPFAFHYDLL